MFLNALPKSSFPCSNILLNVLFASNLLQIRIYSFSIWSSAFGLFSHKHILNNLQIIAISLLFTCYKDKSFNWYRHRDIISRKCQFLELYLAGNLLVLLHWAELCLCHLSNRLKTICWNAIQCKITTKQLIYSWTDTTLNVNKKKNEH